MFHVVGVFRSESREHCSRLYRTANNSYRRDLGLAATRKPKRNGQLYTGRNGLSHRHSMHSYDFTRLL